MKLTVKTLKNEKFDLEVQPEELVRDIKRKIEATKGDDFPAEGMKLISSGVILDDATTIGSHNLKPTDFVVVMCKPRPKVAAAPPPAAAPVVAPAPVAAAPVAAAPPAAPTGDAPTANPSEAVIAQITDMGFPRDQAIAALRAAFGNADRAVEYLMSGAPLDAIGGGVPSAPVGSAPAAPVAAGGAEEEEEGELPALSPSSPLAFLLTNPSFSQLRGVVQQNPQLLPALLQELARSNPDLVQLINQNREDFYLLLNTPVGAGGGAPGAGGPVPHPGGGMQVQVTREENEAIERLCALGFDKALVIQAYFACDKNENLAANYLLQHGNE